MGVWVSSGNAVLIHNNIDGGTAKGLVVGDSFTTGVFVSGIVTLVNNHIAGGKAENGNSRGIVRYGGIGVVVNNTIDGGTASAVSYGIVTGAPGPLDLINNNIWGANQDWAFLYYSQPTNDFNYVIDCARWPAGCGPQTRGNTSVDPLFADPDKRLLDTSPLINGGVDPRDITAGGNVDYTIPVRKPDPVLLMTDFEGIPRSLDGAGWDVGRAEALPDTNHQMNRFLISVDGFHGGLSDGEV